MANAWSVTALAIRIAMFSDQLEVGEFVIETVFVETEHVGIAAEMLVMTIPTLLVTNVRVLAMKSLLLANVQRHIFMTIEAQTSLRRLVESLVA